MAAVTTELKVLVRAVGKNDLDKISASLTKLGKAASSAVNPKVKQSVGELKKLSDQSVKTRANIQGFSNAFKDLANNLEFGSKEFKEATAEAAALDAQLKKLETRKPPTAAQRLRRGAQTAGAIAAGGVFGGPEGAVGAALGAIGGPAGAAVGAAIGAQVGQLRQALGATAEYAANLSKLRIALEGVTTSQDEYSQALSFITDTTKQFAIPQDVVTRQFTKLQASVQGAGGNLEDTKTAFNGIVAAVRATGGSLADVDAALTATAQVFSKGKVSAEELRQQIGERLPGAFTLFAESMGITPQELDKALEQGKVSLQDFQRFAEAIFERYGQNAQAIAKGPDSAGDQLKVTLQQLNEEVGRILKPLGAEMQRTFNGIAKSILGAVQALDKFFGISGEQRKNALITQVNATNLAIRKARQNIRGFSKEIEESGDIGGIRAGLISREEQLIKELEGRRERIRNELNDLTRGQAVTVLQPTAGTGLPGIIQEDKEDKPSRSSRERKDISEELLRLGRELNEARLTGNQFLIVTKQLKFDIQKITESELQPNEKVLALENASVKANEKILNLMSGKPAKVKELTQELTETEKLFESIKDTVATGLANAIQGLIDGTKSLGESLSGILRQLGSMILQFGMKSLVGSLFPSADGNIVANNKIVPFAYGGVVNKPTLFPMANGAGLMGEAGPEAIMPLRRTASGRLGVESSGGVGNVVVNVDATGSSVQGDQPNADQLGRLIGAAVQAELVRQKRPGGLLAR